MLLTRYDMLLAPCAFQKVESDTVILQHSGSGNGRAADTGGWDGGFFLPKNTTFYATQKEYLKNIT